MMDKKTKLLIQRLNETNFDVYAQTKHILTARENELRTLVRKRGLSIQQIIDRGNPTKQELAWIWEYDRQSWLEHPQSERFENLTDRENELLTLVRNRTFSVKKIIEHCNPTTQELIWMWGLDRKSLLEYLQNERLENRNKQ